MPPRILELQEESDFYIPAHEFDEEAAVMLYERYRNKISIDFPTRITKNSYVVRSSGYIGQIPLCDRFLLVINPKVPLGNVFGMLNYALDLKLFEFLPERLTGGSISDIFEKLVSALAQRVLLRAKKGLYRDYVNERESLNFVRGRCQWVGTLRSAMRGSIRLDCEYQENTADLEDNQILAWTLYTIPRFNLRDPAIKKTAAKAYRALSSAVSVTRVPSEACIGRFYNRLNNDYEPMHDLCRFFLENCGPILDKGDRTFIPFLLYMPTLFESFVARWLESHLPTKYSMQRQFSVRLVEGETWRFQMDIVIRDAATNKIVAVLDTKYKNVERAAENDISQVVAYAVQANTQRAFLAYPTSSVSTVTIPVGGDRGVRVKMLSFNISGDLEEGGNRFLGDLLAGF